MKEEEMGRCPNPPIGIMPYKEFKKYTMAIACGKHKPKKGEPKIWFESIETMSQVASFDTQPAQIGGSTDG